MGTVVTGGSLKALGVFGVLSLLLLVAYGRVAGGPAEAVTGPGPTIAMPALAAVADVAQLSTSLSEYVFLHQNRDEDIRIHGMAGMLSCTE